MLENCYPLEGKLLVLCRSDLPRSSTISFRAMRRFTSLITVCAELLHNALRNTFIAASARSSSRLQRSHRDCRFIVAVYITLNLIIVAGLLPVVINTQEITEWTNRCSAGLQQSILMIGAARIVLQAGARSSGLRRESSSCRCARRQVFKSAELDDIIRNEAGTRRSPTHRRF